MEAHEMRDMLISQGIDASIADAMVKSASKANKPKGRRGGFTKSSSARQKITAAVVVQQHCVTCGSDTSFKQVMRVYDTEVNDQTCTVGLCINCIKMMDTMSKDELISLIVIQNHPDAELRNLGTRSQLKMAKTQSAQHWLTTRNDRAIRTNDEGKVY